MMMKHDEDDDDDDGGADTDTDTDTGGDDYDDDDVIGYEHKYVSTIRNWLRTCGEISQHTQDAHQQDGQELDWSSSSQSGAPNR